MAGSIGDAIPLYAHQGLRAHITNRAFIEGHGSGRSRLHVNLIRWLEQELR